MKIHFRNYKIPRTLLLICYSLLMLVHAVAQPQTRVVKEVKFEDFLQQVLVNNLRLISEQYDVSVAEAAVVAARVLRNPELEIILPMFKEDELNNFPTNISYKLEAPIELFGKRRNRIRKAEMEKMAAEADLDDFMRFLIADAAIAYVKVLSKQSVYQRLELTYDQFNQLNEISKALFEAGEIGELDLLRTNLEARKYEAKLYDHKADFNDLMFEIYFLLGGITTDSLVFTGNIGTNEQFLDFENLRSFALEFRADIRAARFQQDAAEFDMRLTRSERLPDITLIAGYHNEQAVKPFPGIKASYAGLIVPLQFSGFNRGALLESQHRFNQSKAQFHTATLGVETELQAAWNRYQLMLGKRSLFTESILINAERVRDAMVRSYQAGEVSLLEVLMAQQTLNEIYIDYYETLAQYTLSIIEISKSTGQWLVIIGEE